MTVPTDVGGFRVFPDDVTAASGEIKGGKGVYEDDEQFPCEVKGENFFTKIEEKFPFLSWQPMFPAFTWARRVQTRHHNGMCYT